MIFAPPERFSLFRGDCFEIMRDLPDGTVDLILTDLPYGTTRNKWDNVIPFDEMWDVCRRIIKPNGAILLFCDGLFMARLMESNEKEWRYNLVWDKRRGSDFLNANRKPLKSHEEIAVFYKRQPVYHKQFWFSTPYKRTKNGSLSDNYGNRQAAFSESRNGERNPLTILPFARDAERYHPTQKPVALLEWLIRTYTDENDLVLDFCMGSGSTGVAAIKSGRRFIGIDINTEYADTAQKRIDAMMRGKG